MPKIFIETFIGDSPTVDIPLTRNGEEFTPTGWNLIFTAKNFPTDADILAVFQKITGAGITQSGPVASVSLIAQDTLGRSECTLYFDIQGQNASTGEIGTFAYGEWRILRDITRGVAPAIPIYTTEPPTYGPLVFNRITNGYERLFIGDDGSGFPSLQTEPIT